MLFDRHGGSDADGRALPFQSGADEAVLSSCGTVVVGQYGQTADEVFVYSQIPGYVGAFFHAVRKHSPHY